MKKNSEREASLLDEWRKGTPAREAARMTGVPEGTVYYYWKRFSRDPEKANRLAASIKPRRKLSDADIGIQLIKAQSAEEVQAKFDSLVKEGKFEEAEHYIRAQREAERYRNERARDVSSTTVLYLSNPERNAHLVLDAAREMLQWEMDKGVAFLDAVSSVKEQTAATAQIMHNPDLGVKLVNALEVLKNEYLAEQKEKKPEDGIGLDELADRFVEREEKKKEHERMEREAKAKGKRESLDERAREKLYELREDQSTKGPSLSDTMDPKRGQTEQAPPKRKTLTEAAESGSDDEKGR